MSGSLKAQRHLWFLWAVLHPDLSWLKPQLNVRNDRTGRICFSPRPFSVLTKQRVLSPSRAFQKLQDWLSEGIACYTIIYCFSSFQMNWAFCWVKQNHTGGDRLPLALAVLSLEGGLWQSPHVLGTLLKWVTLHFLELCPHILWMWIHLLTNSVCSNRLLWTIGLIWFCCCKDMDI